ncbi:uncharacterized protein LOC121381304 [Gigantopelta aegis]|uniref:uncharacterized protein LOC121381304 n=1 Tax=Gigantopelta aegis TaxID=1735272 RepID=UPI001B88DC06|nr:uncharacterized protein LOC121381304 [Gigantopelta aegis]
MAILRNLCRLCFHKYKVRSLFFAPVRYFARTPCVSVKSTVSAANPSIKLRYVYVQTCVNTWEDIPNGVLFDVCYADSHPDDDLKTTASLPTIVALHNTPGSHDDLIQVLESFVLMGCRVIAPNFPGFGHTEGLSSEHDEIFMHTNDEKSQFVCDFLENIGIKRVDMIIGIGSGCFPLLRLCTSVVTKDIFKSAVFISPWPVTEDFRLIQPISIHRAVVWLWEHPVYRPLVFLIVHMRKMLFSGFSEFIVKDFVCTSYTICGIDFAEVAGLAVGLSHMEIPKLVLFGENDEFIPSPLVEDLVKMLGIPRNKMIECDEKGNLNNSYNEREECPNSVVFLHGSKDLFHDYETLTITLLWKFLKNIRPDIK